MIVRILNEGQWELADTAVRELNALDDGVEQAVGANDQEKLTTVLHQLLDRVRSSGTRVPDAEIRDSDLILPSSDSSIAEVASMLNDDGLIPN